MKIHIFGDSFADPTCGMPADWSWPNRIASKYQAVNHAVSGSGLEWSHLKLREESNKIGSQDKIIFVASEVDRMLVNKEWINSKVSPHIIALNKTKFWDKVNDSKLKQTIKTTAKNYYKFFGSRNIMQLRYESIVSYLKSCYDKQILILVAFEPKEIAKTLSSALTIDKKEPYRDNKVLLYDISFFEIQQIWPEQKRRGWIDPRPCHLTELHHDMLFNKIDNWILDGEFSLEQSDLINFPPHTIEKYRKIL